MSRNSYLALHPQVCQSKRRVCLWAARVALSMGGSVLLVPSLALRYLAYTWTTLPSHDTVMHKRRWRSAAQSPEPTQKSVFSPTNALSNFLWF